MRIQHIWFLLKQYDDSKGLKRHLLGDHPFITALRNFYNILNGAVDFQNPKKDRDLTVTELFELGTLMLAQGENFKNFTHIEKWDADPTDLECQLSKKVFLTIRRNFVNGYIPEMGEADGKWLYKILAILVTLGFEKEITLKYFEKACSTPEQIYSLYCGYAEFFPEGDASLRYSDIHKSCLNFFDECKLSTSTQKALFIKCLDFIHKSPESADILRELAMNRILDDLTISALFKLSDGAFDICTYNDIRLYLKGFISESYQESKVPKQGTSSGSIHQHLQGIVSTMVQLQRAINRYFDSLDSPSINAFRPLKFTGSTFELIYDNRQYAEDIAIALHEINEAHISSKQISLLIFQNSAFAKDISEKLKHLRQNNSLTEATFYNIISQLQKSQMEALCMGLHSRLGAQSPIFSFFRRNPIGDRTVLRVVNEFINPRLSTISTSSLKDDAGFYVQSSCSMM